ncbi:hypothetical protein Gotur_013994, partial [Gossypium turneri]
MGRIIIILFANEGICGKRIKLIFFFGFRYRHEAIDFPLSSSVLRDDMLRLIKVEEFFNLFFPDNAVNFIESFHRRCGDK